MARPGRRVGTQIVTGRGLKTENAELSSYAGPCPATRARWEDMTDKQRADLAAAYIVDASEGIVYGDFKCPISQRLYYKMEWIFTIALLIYMLVPFFAWPCWCFSEALDSCGDPDIVLTSQLPVMGNNSSLGLELICLFVLAISSALRAEYMGRTHFFSKNEHKFEVLLLILSMILVILLFPLFAKRGGISDFANIPRLLVSLMRPALFVCVLRRVRHLLRNLVRIVPTVVPLLLLLLFLVVYFGAIGLFLFRDVRFVGLEDGSAAHDTYFRTFGGACMSMFVLLTTCNFPDVMMPVYSQRRWTVAFFILFLVVGLFLLMTLVLATVYDAYKKSLAADACQFKHRRRQGLSTAFDVLSAGKENTGQPSIKRAKLVQALTHMWQHYPGIIAPHPQMLPDAQIEFAVTLMSRHDCLSFKEFQKLFDCLHMDFVEAEEEEELGGAWQEISSPKLRSGYRSILFHVFEGRSYESIVCAFVTLDCIAVTYFCEVQLSFHDAMLLELPFTLLLSLEAFFKFIAYRDRFFGDYFARMFDTVVVLFALVLEAFIAFAPSEHFGPLYFSSSEINPSSSTMMGLPVPWQWIYIVILLRAFRLLRFLSRTAFFGTYFSVFWHMRRPISSVLGLLMVVLYTYAAVGVFAFGGLVYIGNPALDDTDFKDANYFANNFNDFGSALVTLFELLVVNNWHITMEGIAAVTGSDWSRLYFITFYLISVVVVLNLSVALIVDVYMSVSERKSSATPPEPLHTFIVDRRKSATWIKGASKNGTADQEKNLRSPRQVKAFRTHRHKSELFHLYDGPQRQDE